MTELCDSCIKEHNAWYSYRVRAPFQIHQVGDSLREVRDKQQHRTQEWADTINSQQAIIREICGRIHRGAA